MRKRIFGMAVLLGLCLIAGCSSKPQEDQKDAQYDTIIYGNIFVGDNSEETVEAVVIKDGIIEYAGSKEGAKDYKSKAKEVIELSDDEFVMPGVIDGHSHPAVAWDGKLNCIMLEAGWDMEKYIEVITDFVKKNPDADCYRVKGYIESEFKTDEQKSNPKAILDAICSDKPIVATDSGGHGMWCNTKAIEMICEKYENVKKVDKDNAGHDTKSVSGGTVERNSSGEATGFFRDGATSIVNNACVKFTKESYKKSILKAQEEYASLGYTSYNESMINESANVTETPKAEAYMELEEEGKLTSYVAGSFIVSNTDSADELVDMAIKLKDETKGGNFEVTDIKIFMDGVVEGGSAYLVEPYEHYANGDDAGDYRGTTPWPEKDLDKLTKLIAKANDAGMACHFHAIGDQSILNTLNCIEAAAEEIGIDKVKEARNVITHLQILDESAYEKFEKYNVIANLNPWACKGKGFYDEVEVLCLGEERASNEYPYKTFLDKGIHCAFGTDYGSSNIYKFNENFLALTARKTGNSTKDAVDDSTLLNEKEKLTASEALNIMTEGSAYQMKKENEIGAIKVGMQANLVVLNKNLLTIEEKDIMSIEPEKTMFQGNWIYSK